MAISRMQQTRQMYQEGGIMPRLNQLGSGVSSAEQMLQGINQRLESAESSLGEGGENTAPIGSDSYQLAGGFNTMQPQLNLGQNNLSSIINPIRPGGQGSTLSSTYSNNYIGDRGSEQSSPISQLMVTGFDNIAGGDPRLGAPDVPNSLQQVMRGARANGGMMGRQNYGLGSLVKSAVKGVTGAVKGAAGAVKDFAKSDAGKLALLGGALYLGGGTGGISSLFGKAKSFLGGLPGAEAIGGYLKTKGGRALGIAAAGSLLGGLAAKVEEGDPEAVAATRDVGALRNYLTEGYKNLGYAEEEIPALVDKDVSEYSQDRARVGAAYGGRMQYGLGDLVRKSASFTAVPNEEVSVPSGGKGFGGMIAQLIQNNPQLFKATNQESTKLSPEEILQIMSRNTFSNGSDEKSEMAKRVEELMDDGYTFGEAVKEIMKEGLKNGGRPGFAMGNKAEQNAINAAGIMGLPLNQNPAGVTELDLRETGGFIAPVGVKEKADDIPAMLSNNEFVMTADAVRNMGDGNVNKGAQRMYDMMKALEKRVV